MCKKRAKSITQIRIWLRVSALLTLFPAQVFSEVVSTEYTFTTALKEVQSGSIDGKDYLNIRINGSAGPSLCHGNLLTFDNSRLSDNSSKKISNIALAAMLNDEPVVITVPRSASKCVDGMPVLTDLYLLTNRF